jgi:pilus assembly protein TadC
MRSSVLRRIAIGAVVGTAAVVLIGGWVGLAAGIAAGAATFGWYDRLAAAKVSSEDRRAAADLPFACDLLAAAMRAGAPPDVASRCVARAVGGPLGARLDRVHRALRLGAGGDEAWSYLGPVDGAHRVIQAAVRSGHSGAAFAGALQRVADDVRSDRLIALDTAARRAGVLIVLPLGLCFLPAFVLSGLVPVIVAVLGDALSP